MEDQVTWAGEGVSTTVSKKNVSYHFLTHAEHSQSAALQLDFSWILNMLKFYMEVFIRNNFINNCISSFKHLQPKNTLNIYKECGEGEHSFLISSLSTKWLRAHLIDVLGFHCCFLGSFSKSMTEISLYINPSHHITSQIVVEYPGMSFLNLIALINLSNLWGCVNSFWSIWIHLICQYTPISRFDKYNNITKNIGRQGS